MSTEVEGHKVSFPKRSDVIDFLYHLSVPEDAVGRQLGPDVGGLPCVNAHEKRR